jgi:hypothetical protein
MTARVIAIALAVAGLAVPACAFGAGGWSAPVTISGDGASRPRVVTADEGAVVAAWSGATGVQASTRPRRGVFRPPVTLAPSPGFLLDLAAYPDGDLTAAWINAGPAVETAWGTAGEFGPRVRFPFDGVPLVAAAPGGDAFYSWVEGDGRLLAVRRREGTFGRPFQVATGLGLAALAVDATGALTVVAVGADGTVFAATGTPEAGFSAPRAISAGGAPGGTGESGGSGAPAGSGAPGGSVAGVAGVGARASPRGDILVSWITPAAQLAAAIRPAGADWGAPETVPGSQGAQQPDAALDDGGNAIVAWTDGKRARLAYRHADGRWGQAERASTRPVCCTPGPPPCCELRPRAGFDAHGTAVIAWSDAGLPPSPPSSPTAPRTLRAAVRPPEGPVRPYEALSTGAGLGELDLAVDPQRNATAVWSAPTGTGPVIRTTAFDPSAPAITAFAPGTRARPATPHNVVPPGFAYSVSEPASVRVDIDRLTPARARLGTLRSMGSSRSGRLTLSARLARRLAKLGRYRATVTATTRGGRHPQPRHIDFRRVKPKP